MDKLTITIDGTQFADFECFVRHAAIQFSAHTSAWWTGNLDMLDDILRDVPGEFQIVWLHSELSRHCLGHWAMVIWLTNNMKHCHPSNIPSRAESLIQARSDQGPTLFDFILEIIQRHKSVEVVLR